MILIHNKLSKLKRIHIENHMHILLYNRLYCPEDVG